MRQPNRCIFLVFILLISSWLFSFLFVIFLWRNFQFFCNANTSSAIQHYHHGIICKSRLLLFKLIKVEVEAIWCVQPLLIPKKNFLSASAYLSMLEFAIKSKLIPLNSTSASVQQVWFPFEAAFVDPCLKLHSSWGYKCDASLPCARVCYVLFKKNTAWFSLSLLFVTQAWSNSESEMMLAQITLSNISENHILGFPRSHKFLCSNYTEEFLHNNDATITSQRYICILSIF